MGSKPNLPRGMYLRGRQLYGRFRDPATGQWVRRSLGTDRRAAIAAFERYRSEGLVPGAPPSAPRVLLRDVLDGYMRHVERTYTSDKRWRNVENTERARSVIYRHWSPDATVRELSQTDFYTFRQARRGEVGSSASCNHTIRVLRAALNRAVRDELLERAPFRVELLPEPAKRNRALSASEVRAVLDAARASDDRAFMVCYLAWRLGLRLGEIVHLDWGDVDLEARTLEVQAKRDWSPKTRQRRALVLDDEAASVLREWRGKLPRTGPADPIVPMAPRDAERFTVQWAGAICSKAFRAAGIAEGGVHRLRHTFVTDALEAGVPVHVAQKLAGHAALQTTLGYYAHVRDEAMRDAAELLARKRSGASSGSRGGLR